MKPKIKCKHQWRMITMKESAKYFLDGEIKFYCIFCKKIEGLNENKD
jgi:hypothetical protein